MRINTSGEQEILSNKCENWILKNLLFQSGVRSALSDLWNLKVPFKPYIKQHQNNA